MGGKRSAFLIGAMLDHVFGGTVYVPPEVIYVGLWTETVTARGDGKTAGEVQAPDYRRLAIPNTPKFWAKTVVGLKQLAESARFPDAKSEWGLIRHVCLLDQERGGNLLYCMAPKRPRLVQEDDAVEFGAGGIKLMET